MKSLTEYTDEELTTWVNQVRNEREIKRNIKIETAKAVHKEKREKAEKVAKGQGIEVIDGLDGAMGDILKQFLKG